MDDRRFLCDETKLTAKNRREIEKDFCRMGSIINVGWKEDGCHFCE